MSKKRTNHHFSPILYTYFKYTYNIIPQNNLKIYLIQDILDDWKGNCKFVPANDARVFFVSWNGQPISPYEYKDFESLIQYLTELMK